MPPLACSHGRNQCAPIQNFRQLHNPSIRRAGQVEVKCKICEENLFRKTPVKFLVRADPKPKPVIVVTAGDGAKISGDANRPCAIVKFQTLQLQTCANLDAPDSPRTFGRLFGRRFGFAAAGRDTISKNPPCRASSLFQRFVVQRQKTFRLLRIFGIQFVKQRSQHGTRRGIIQDRVPAVRRKGVGAKRGNVLNKLMARFGRQLGNGFFNFQQRFHTSKMRQPCKSVNAVNDFNPNKKTRPELLPAALDFRFL